MSRAMTLKYAFHKHARSCGEPKCGFAAPTAQIDLARRRPGTLAGVAAIGSIRSGDL